MIAISRNVLTCIVTYNAAHKYVVCRMSYVLGGGGGLKMTATTTIVIITIVTLMIILVILVLIFILTGCQIV